MNSSGYSSDKAVLSPLPSEPGPISMHKGTIDLYILVV
jgi:hypothetical protein